MAVHHPNKNIMLSNKLIKALDSTTIQRLTIEQKSSGVLHHKNIKAYMMQVTLPAPSGGQSTQQQYQGQQQGANTQAPAQPTITTSAGLPPPGGVQKSNGGSCQPAPQYIPLVQLVQKEDPVIDAWSKSVQVAIGLHRFI
eukprot:11243796-Ditylum_brightwellii.AAC.1